MSATRTAADGGHCPAVEAWVDAYGDELQRHLARLLGDGADAQDVLQQVWITAMERPPDSGPDANVRAWLYRVATNRALDTLAASRRRRSLRQRANPGRSVGDQQPPDAGAFGLDEEARIRVRGHCARLPRKQREAVWLRWVEGLDYLTIAERIGSTPGSARANVYQGMKRLRRELDDLWTKESG